MAPIHDLRKHIGNTALAILVIFAILYGGFRAYSLLAGPSITIFSPQDGQTVASSTFSITGQVLRAKEITLGGRPITTDTQGRFTETLVAQAPYTILIVVATDKYGATVSKTLRVIPAK